MPGRLRWRDPPVRHLGGGLLPQPRREPASRRHLRHPLSERLPSAARRTAFPPVLDPAHRHRVTAPADIPRPGQHRVVPAGRDRPAVRARRRGRVIGDRPYLQRAVRQRLRISDLQALHAEQHRRRILEHDARGFLMISDPVVRPKIVKAAGSCVTAARRNYVLSPEPGRRRAGHAQQRPRLTQSHHAVTTSRLTSKARFTGSPDSACSTFSRKPSSPASKSGTACRPLITTDLPAHQRLDNAVTTPGEESVRRGAGDPADHHPGAGAGDEREPAPGLLHR